MSELPPSTPPAPTPPRGGTSVGRILLLAVGLVAAAAVVYGVIYYKNQDATPVASMTALKGYITQVDRFSKLDAAYADANGDLVADEPTDATKFVDPPELAFTAVVYDDADKAEATWTPFLVHLAKATGKKVVYLKSVPGTTLAPVAPPAKVEGEDAVPPVDPNRLQSLDQQLAAVKAGKLHVTAFSTGAVAQAVGTAGFVPLYAPADAAGNFTYEMEIVVPADSPVQKPEDLKGKQIAFTNMSSNSGAKAPLVTLKEQFNLLPDRDYTFAFTGDHRQAVKDLLAGKFAAACVANDILGQLVADGTVKKDAVRSVYKSKAFPPAVFGVPVVLAPAARAAVKKAFETFAFAGTSVGERYKAQQRVKFAAVDYKKDFEFVREVDGKLAKFFDGK